jgi:hypothetical protein
MNPRKAKEGAPEELDSAKGKESKRSKLEPSSSDQLPSSYGETIVMLVPVDPTIAHVYWDVSPEDMERSGSAPTALRVYDIHGRVFDGTNARGFFDVDIELDDRSSYVSLPDTEGSCQVDLGFITEDGGFVALAQSNSVQTPKSAPSARGEHEYLFVRGDYEEVQVVPQDTPTHPPDDLEAQPAEEDAGPTEIARAPAGEDLPENRPAGQSEGQAEPLAEQTGDVSGTRPTGAPAGEAEKTDLTEWSERNFTSGLSSN